MYLTSKDIEVIKHGEVAAKKFGWLEYADTLSICPCCRGEGSIIVENTNILPNCICNGIGKLKKLLHNNERMECASKLKILDMGIPWARWQGEE